METTTRKRPIPPVEGWTPLVARIPTLVFVILLGFLILAPIVAMFYGALRPSISSPALDLTADTVVDVYTSLGIWRSLAGTMGIALAVAVLATAAGALFAWFITRTDVPLRPLIELLVLAPLFLSPFVAAIAWYALAAPRSGFLNLALIELLGSGAPTLNVTSVAGIIWVLALHTMPYAYVFVSSSLRNMDPALEAASHVNGVGHLGTLRRVTLPMMTPALGSSIMFVTIFAASIFSVPAVLGRTLSFVPIPVLIYRSITRFRADYAEAAALGSMLFILSVLFLYGYRVLTRMERKYVTVSGKGFQPRPIELGPWRYVVTAAAMGYGVICVALPILMLGIAAMSPYSARNLGDVELSPGRALGVLTSSTVRTATVNTGWVVLLSVLGCLAIALITVFIARGTGERKTAAVLDYLNTFPLAVPGIVLASGLIWVYIRTPVYATLLILVIAFVISNVPHAYRLIRNGSLQLSRELEEASHVNGVGRAGTALKITIPLLRPSIFSAIILVTIFVIREVNSIILLYTPGTRVLSVLTWDYIADGNLSSAAAVGLLQTVLLLAALVVGRLIFRVDVSRTYR